MLIMRWGVHVNNYVNIKCLSNNLIYKDQNVQQNIDLYSEMNTKLLSSVS